MNLSLFTPEEAPVWNSINPRDDPSQLWFLYHWINARSRGTYGREWNQTPTQVKLASNPVCHPTLALHIDDFPQTEDRKLSYVAFGPPRPGSSTTDCFFLRTTDSNGTWDYHWAGLPSRCEMAVQRHIRGGDAANGRNEWVDGRLRAVEFGYNGSWVVYGGRSNYDWWLSPKHYGPELARALQDGKDHKWSINKISLNVRNPKEYVLAFNEEADIYAALYKSFMPDFKEVVSEWAAGKGLTPKPNYVELDDADCDYRPPTSTSSITEAGSFGIERYPLEEEDLMDISPTVSRTTRHMRSDSHQNIQHSRQSANLSSSSFVGYNQQRGNTTFIRPAPQVIIMSPPPDIVELEGTIPQHYHNHPADERHCVLCRAGYVPSRM